MTYKEMFDLIKDNPKWMGQQIIYTDGPMKEALELTIDAPSTEANITLRSKGSGSYVSPS